MTPYLVRTTLWHDSEGDLRQASVAVLDSAWEPLVERTVDVGPFDDQAAAIDRCRADALSWVARNGVQVELFAP